MMLAPSAVGCWPWLRGRLMRPEDHRGQQDDTYRDLLIRDPELQAETLARLFW
ncbi:hypothetical protein [Hydrocarboniphaga effusa]|jgi:hypothetical protein|uniref:hypothetical protein n=1 Tax=Hydrocarboniphaga effusa TaxID=243629 RepID=UPI003137FA03